MDMNQMMQQAQQMQLELARAQEEIQSMTYTATAGGGMVEATANGNGLIESLSIDPEAVDPDDVEMLQDMVLVAVNEALRGVAAAGEERMASVTGGLNIPGLF
jgi:DNA-binding YbaB/EbfC family protein